MNVQRIDSAKSTPNFGMLKPGTTMSAETFDKLINIPVVSNFSKNFDGDIYVGRFIGRKSEKSQYSLDIRNVVPRSIMAKVKNFFSRENRDMVVLKTHAKTFEEFQVALNRRPKKALSKIFFDKES